MPTNDPHPYTRAGLLAINPQAFGMLFAAFEPPAEPYSEPAEGVAVVDVRGPIANDGWFCDTYSGIRARTAAALASPAHTVVLRIDSPGGDVYECFDTARALAAMAAAAGKRLWAHSSAQMCSSAYALACATTRITASASATVGSVGILNAILDTTAADLAGGVRWNVVTSGKRKADGNPHVAITDGATTAMQAQVDILAGQFFAWVSERRGIAPDAITAFEAATFVGSEAPSVGLTDGAEAWDDLLALAAQSPAGEGATLPPTQPEHTMADDIREALAKAADDEDKEKAAKARAALAAWDKAQAEESKENATAEDEEPEKDPDAKACNDGPKGEEDDGPPKDDDSESKASAVAGALASELSALRAENDRLRAAQVKAERDALFASRPDVGEKIKASLAEVPIAQARAVLDAIEPPKATRASGPPKTVAPLAGEGRGAGGARPLNALSGPMGLLPTRVGSEFKDGVLKLGVVQPALTEDK